MNAIVVIAASAGGLEPLGRIIATLPVSCTASVFVVMHIGRNPSVLPSLLGRTGRLPAAFAQDGADATRDGLSVAGDAERAMPHSRRSEPRRTPR